MQLRFTSLAVINLRRDLHPQECAHAGRTQKTKGPQRGPIVCVPEIGTSSGSLLYVVRDFIYRRSVEKLDKSHWCIVAITEPALENTQVTTIPI